MLSGRSDKCSEVVKSRGPGAQTAASCPSFMGSSWSLDQPVAAASPGSLEGQTLNPLPDPLSYNLHLTRLPDDLYVRSSLRSTDLVWQTDPRVTPPIISTSCCSHLCGIPSPWVRVGLVTYFALVEYDKGEEILQIWLMSRISWACPADTFTAAWRADCEPRNKKTCLDSWPAETVS